MKNFIKITIASVVAVLAATSCSSDSGVSPDRSTSVRDTLDNTVWTSYMGNGVYILRFYDGMYYERFYDGVSAEASSEVKPYTVSDNAIDVVNADSTVTRLIYEITAGGNTLSIYRNNEALNENRPNVVFRKL